MAEWSRLVATTISDYAKDYEDKLIAKRILLAALRKSGNIKYNCGGAGSDNHFAWQLPYRQVPLIVDDAETPVTPSRKDRFKRPSLTYKGYRSDDMLTKREKLLNKGPGALINYYEEMSQMLLDDFTQKFSEELYVDDSASGNSGRLTGIESLFALNGTVKIDAGTQRSANAADVAGYPNDTYAGLSTVLGNYAGSWSTQSAISSTWPAGFGDLAYDFFSPIVVNYTSTAFAGTTATWADNCVTSTRYLITHMNRYVSERGDLKTILLDRELYRQYLNKLDSKERFISSSAAVGLRALGFDDTFQQDGVDIAWEFGMPAAVGYGYNIKHMKLRSCQEQLFMTEGPWYEKLQRSYVVIVDFFGNLQFAAPRFFGKLAALA